MKLLISILITLVHVTYISATKIETPKCCANDKNLLLESQCEVNSEGKHPPIPLECPERYILDPTMFDHDRYTVTDNGTLRIEDLNSVLFSDE